MRDADRYELNNLRTKSTHGSFIEPREKLTNAAEGEEDTQEKDL